MTTFPLRLLGRVSPKALAVSTGACPACGSTVFVRFADDEIAVRCLRCRGTPVHLAVVHAVRSNLKGAPAELDAYEMSSRGPLLSWLRRTFRHVTCSEFMPDVPPGEVAGGIRSEDVQKLTFADASFDVCTSTEVFEHVPDDRAGFREVARVTKPGGLFVFTVPLSASPHTVERAKLVDGELVHMHPPAYHGDRLTGEDTVLVFRDYGLDLVDRLVEAGFEAAWLCDWAGAPFRCTRSAIVALKGRGP